MTNIFSSFFRSFQPRMSQAAMSGAMAPRRSSASARMPASSRQPVDNSRYLSRFEGPARNTRSTRAARTASSSRAVPANLRAYGNGRIPANQLQSIGGGHRLNANAATAFNRMRADAARAGVRFGVTDSYRSYAAQVDVARRKGLYRNGGLAATPGTSKHGWGQAVDLSTNRTSQAWLRQNAARYGFHTIPREPWHWEFRG